MIKQLTKPGKLYICLFSFFLFISVFSSTSWADVYINEVMSSNASTITDPFGNYSDWIEIYNMGNTPYDLSSHLIADDSSFTLLPSSGSLPALIIPPNSYRIIWANDVAVNNCVPRNEICVPWKLAAEGDMVRLIGPGNIGLIDEVTLPQAATDESFGRYPDGIGNFERMLLPTPGSQNQTNNFDFNVNAHFIKLNEFVTSNQNGIQDEDLEASDWLELYNSYSEPINLLGLRLSDDSKQWVFPDVDIPANGFLFVWASDKNRRNPDQPLHTNFRISASGENIRFMNTDGSIEDEVFVPGIPTDLSFGRIPDGSNSFAELQTPTPGTSNIYEEIQPNPDAVWITINEVVSNNISGIRDFENEYHDWIELYNKSTSITVNLEGLRLADSTRVWSLPEYQLQPDHYLVIFASKKNLTVPEFHTNFNVSSTEGEQIALLNKNSDLIEIVSVDPLDADVSFARDPNGTGNFRIFSVPTPGAENENIDIEPNQDAHFISINEILTNPTSGLGLPDEDEEYNDWIELFNTSNSTAVDLSGLKLQDPSATWVFPQSADNPSVIIPPHQYLIVFASDKNRISGELHTNFKLSSSGDSLTLLNLDNSTVSTVDIISLPPDTSYGRLPNGTGEYTVFQTPTPLAENEVVEIEPNADAVWITFNEIASNWQSDLFVDDDGDIEDWIELYNYSNTVTVDMEGLKLRDPNDIWTFPAGVSIAPHEYLIIFASEKDKRDPSGTLHTNFRISSQGELLQYLNKDNSVVEGFDPFPPLEINQTYGRLPDGTGNYQMLSSATPGGTNSPPPDIIYGDVNGDGRVTSVDAAMIAAHVVGAITLTQDQFIRADVNLSQTITSLDAAIIAAYVVGAIPQLPI